MAESSTSSSGMTLAASSLRLLAEQRGHVVDHLGVTHPAVDVGVEVGVLGAHPAHVQREMRLHQLHDAGRSSVTTTCAVAQISKVSLVRRAPGLANPSSSHSLYMSAMRGQ